MAYIQMTVAMPMTIQTIGYDSDGDGGVRYSDMMNLNSSIDNGKIGDYRAQSTRQFYILGQFKIASVMLTYLSKHLLQVGYITSMWRLGRKYQSRLQDLVIVGWEDRRFTNLDEFNARDRDGDGAVDGRSTDPLSPDTDGDGLIDGIK